MECIVDEEKVFLLRSGRNYPVNDRYRQVNRLFIPVNPTDD
jgi:hypothetical protein